MNRPAAQIVFLLVGPLLLAVLGCHPGASSQRIATRQFGAVRVYRGTGSPKGVALLLSGEEGWKDELAQVAKAIAEQGYVVGGVDIRDYERASVKSSQSCANPAVDLAELARVLERRFWVSANPGKPSLPIGYAEGGGLVYLALAHASAGTFHAGISLGFCPNFPVKQWLCEGAKPAPLLNAEPAATTSGPRNALAVPWFVFQLGGEQKCSPTAAADFVGRLRDAKVVSPDGAIAVAPGEKAWVRQLVALVQWLDPRIDQQVLDDASVQGVPLTEVRATGGEGKHLAVMLSGDGGWARLDRSVAAGLARSGIDVVGWDSLAYFWNAKTPEQAAADLARVLNHYLTAWHKDRALLIGYSFGADVLPFMASRLPSSLRERVDLIVFLGLGKRASFEFHLANWIGVATGDTLAVPPEVSKLHDLRCMCVYGEREPDSACAALRSAGVMVVEMPGDHHFGGAYQTISNRIIEALEETPPRQG